MYLGMAMGFMMFLIGIGLFVVLKEKRFQSNKESGFITIDGFVIVLSVLVFFSSLIAGETANYENTNIYSNKTVETIVEDESFVVGVSADDNYYLIRLNGEEVKVPSTITVVETNDEARLVKQVHIHSSKILHVLLAHGGHETVLYVPEGAIFQKIA